MWTTWGRVSYSSLSVSHQIFIPMLLYDLSPLSKLSLCYFQIIKIIWKTTPWVPPQPHHQNHLTSWPLSNLAPFPCSAVREAAVVLHALPGSWEGRSALWATHTYWLIIAFPLCYGSLSFDTFAINFLIAVSCSLEAVTCLVPWHPASCHYPGWLHCWFGSQLTNLNSLTNFFHWRHVFLWHPSISSTTLNYLCHLQLKVHISYQI